MEKSFYYLVTSAQASSLKQLLDNCAIPYTVEGPGEQLLMPSDAVAFVFPDLPVPQYHIVMRLFGGVGEPY